MGEKKRRSAGGAQAHAARSRAFAAQSAFGPALEEMVLALELGPEADAFWAQFGDLIRFFNFRHPLDPRLTALLARALEHPAVDPGDLVRPISSTALSREDPLEDPLLRRLFEETVIRDPRLEALIVAERRRALEGASVALDRLVAIAHQCFNTEYVFAECEAESRAVAALAPGDDPQRLALYAAYRPLNTLRHVSNAVASLAQRQIVEPAEEARLRASIPTLGESTSAVSAAVRAQYEENPYPRWRRLPAVPPMDGEAPGRVLIAGCGTGQHAIATARRMPRSEILAIDLSLASLAYAKRKTIELGITNVEYAQADLLALRDIGPFGHIEASGVLHHLADPLEGWRVLTGLLEPGGTMRIGLYSEIGRRGVVRARQLIAERGWPATPAGIRACRPALAADETFAGIVRNEDFYSMSGVRDLLFHVQEHRFELPQVKQMLALLDLQFSHFEFADSGMTLARYSGNPRDLDAWHAFEKGHPDTFSRMYQFWVRKPA